ncbi:CCA tRNA nucleotidyltransferase [Sphingomonas jatrophae]|uniref:Poly(A) polymerase n=1 Tax=Sphingomonas jatrophae TaxID=1166337 RepID=A0A1I6M607_9SPHN|nr:CCA tRNA nucleotidyltransferase [Sphingomonas jatrophae]SFS11144.1 poly(A) polymerase [Sphingomonas jatrophae]
MTLPPEMFARDGLPALLAALDAAADATRVVGGAVRDSLLGLAPVDLDLATRLAPEETLARISAAGFKAVPTGIAHGTVTAVLPSGPVEVTTLRRDVETDGRHAVVAFTDDWREDAARRDFTINALFGRPADGAVIDYFGGRDDLAAGRVRFIGDPLRRIAEDHLRILRFFRFHARFGRALDDAALNACTARANDLMALSRERIADELLKLLALPDPEPTVALMLAHGIFRPVLPEIVDASALSALIAAERTLGVAPDGVRRLAALLPADSPTAEAVARRLKLSNRRVARLVAAADRQAIGSAAELAYRLGAEQALDHLLLTGRADADAAALLAAWQRPTLSLSGGDLIRMGLPPGPVVARTLRLVEDRWVAEGFPPPPRAHALAEEAVAEASRAIQ